MLDIIETAARIALIATYVTAGVALTFGSIIAVLTPLI